MQCTFRKVSSGVTCLSFVVGHRRVGKCDHWSVLKDLAFLLPLMLALRGFCHRLAVDNCHLGGMKSRYSIQQTGIAGKCPTLKKPVTTHHWECALSGIGRIETLASTFS